MATNDDQVELEEDEDFFLFAGPCSVLLHKQAYAEEGLRWRNSDERVAPTSLLHPRSWVDSEFPLCRMRFFEAILCRSIPIVSSLRHTGRNQVELLFIEHQTLIAPDELR